MHCFVGCLWEEEVKSGAIFFALQHTTPNLKKSPMDNQKEGNTSIPQQEHQMMLLVVLLLAFSVVVIV